MNHQVFWPIDQLLSVQDPSSSHYASVLIAFPIVGHNQKRSNKYAQ